MTRFLWLVLALCAGLLGCPARAAERSSQLINRDCTFTLGNPADAQASDHDTAPWRRVDLPHSFVSQPKDLRRARTPAAAQLSPTLVKQQPSRFT